MEQSTETPSILQGFLKKLMSQIFGQPFDQSMLHKTRTEAGEAAGTRTGKKEDRAPRR